MSTDTLTVLTSASGKYATKQFRRDAEGGIQNRSYGSETFFAVEVVPVDGIAGLARALNQIATQPFSFVIRGEPLPHTDRSRTRRLLHARGGEPATFREQPRHFFVIDIDHIACPAGIDPSTDPEGAVEHAAALLPAEFAAATFFWQFSSSQSVFSNKELSLHLWFWNRVPLSDATLTRWAISVNAAAGRKLVDPALYRAVQAHYVAAPIFGKGIDDPLPRRCALRRGLDDEVDILIPPPHPKDAFEPSGGFDPGRGVEAWLSEVGGPRGSRGPILSAIASFFATHGSAADPAGLKDAVREALERIPSERRDPQKHDLYSSNEHLDRMIKWVRERHGERPARAEDRGGLSLDDFFAYMPMHNYIFTPSREPWPASSVNSRIAPIPTGRIDPKTGEEQTIAASMWLDWHRPVEQMTWAPGLPLQIADRLISDGGWIERKGVSCLNMYRPPPTLRGGSAGEAVRWVEHVERIFPESARHIILWLAHRVQRPDQKINHALVLGGPQGIGKDTLLEPVKHTIGAWNFAEASPGQMLGRFNGFLKSVILRISEARDLGDSDRFKFYDHMKAYTAAPPDVLRIDEKHLREHSILNVCGVIITTNHKADGIHLPADDRRHYVAWSECKKEDFDPEYWNGIWGWYGDGGIAHVATYLAGMNLSVFDPKAPPPKTRAFWEIVDASRSPEDAELADALDALAGNNKTADGDPIWPKAVTLADISAKASVEFGDYLRDRKNARRIPHRMEECGYTAVRNDGAKKGLWKVGGRWQAIYARSDLPVRERLAAAQQICEAGRGQKPPPPRDPF